MRNIVRILLGLVLTLIVLAVVSLFFLGSIVKSGVEKIGPRVAKVPVKLDGATISIFNGSGTLKGFVVGNPEGYKTSEAIKVSSISLSLVPSSVLQDKKLIRSLRIEGPEITYELDLKGSNLGKLLENVSGSAATNEPANVTKLQVDELVITGGKIRVAATLLGSAPSLTLPEIRLTNLGEGPDGITPADLSKKVLTALLNETAKVVAANAANLPDRVKALGTPAVDELKKAGSKVTDLFKKK